MFKIFETIFTKITSLVASAIIAVGLVTVPTPPITQMAPNKPTEQLSESQKTSQDNTKRTNDLQNTKTQSESQQQTTEKNQAKETEIITNIKKTDYDQELSQMIAETRQRIDVFNWAVKEATNFIPTVKATMNKYLDDSLMQQSGQELINENDNLASIAKKLVEIETERASKLSSYLGLGIVPGTENFSTIIAQYDNHYKQYESSNSEIKSLMRTFVANEKSVLEKKLAQEKQKTEELKQLLSQEMAARQKQLTDLEAKIEFQQKRYDDCSGETMSFCAGQRAYIASHDLNPLIKEYNALLGNNTGKIYSPAQQTYLIYESNQLGNGGKLYDPNGSTYYTFDCDQWGNCSIY